MAKDNLAGYTRHSIVEIIFHNKSVKFKEYKNDDGRVVWEKVYLVMDKLTKSMVPPTLKWSSAESGSIVERGSCNR